MGDHLPTVFGTDGNLRVLDWRRRLDPQSLNYLIGDHFDTGLPLVNKMWTQYNWLDQNVYRCPVCRQFGACTGYAFANMLGFSPKQYMGLTNEQAHQFYHGAKDNDQWNGALYEGSSVLGAMQYGKKLGLVGEYYWAKTLSEVLHGVCYYGPIDIGIDWTENMFEVDSTGFIHYTGAVAGGHSVVVAGVSLQRKAVWIPNNWSRKWGLNGGAWLSWTDLEGLIEAGGEFALARKVGHKSSTLVLPPYVAAA
jgi:hypothetical protein